ncbi:hypothetical protein [Legionella gresilensis]|uniref:hypothetical protein n=1 Tax=Legionella gresilensis TaxID=91823 RepID=UPI0010414FD4|nr:hypothetical protein [Legionella gresilensis]
MQTKSEELKYLCEKYRQHLEKEIKKGMSSLPQYVQDHFYKYKIEQYPATADLYLYGEIPDCLPNKPSYEENKSLHAALRKYKIVAEMLKTLNNDSDENTKITSFKSVLTQENIQTLSKRRGSSLGNFLENVFQALSLGVYSRFSKGTFQFWKSHGGSFIDKVAEASNKEDSAINPKL